MSERQEFNAATVEEAVDKAAATLGVTPEQLDYKVVDRGSAGFLGMGSRDARILVELPEAGTNVLESAEEDPGPVSKEEQPNRAESASLPALEEPQREEEEAPPQVEPSTVAVDAPYDLILAVDEFMTSLLDRVGFDATVDAYDAGDVISVDVATKEAGLFIGQKGETIDAIQHLLNVSIYKSRPFVKKIMVDSEGYRQRRVEALQGMAHRTARRALREKRPLSLPPMSAAERRVVHLYLKENPGVTTSSEGQEEDRRVVVSPV